MNSQIEIFQSKDGNTHVNVLFDNETVWLNRQQLSILFDRDIKTIGKHVNNVFREGELDPGVVVAKFATTTKHGALEEKAATLLYLVVKNHSFVDGNKRIAAACFLLFLRKNNMLMTGAKTIIDNDTLASLTLFIASSKRDEMDTVKRLVISILNRNRTDEK